MELLYCNLAALNLPWGNVESISHLFLGSIGNNFQQGFRRPFLKGVERMEGSLPSFL